MLIGGDGPTRFEAPVEAEIDWRSANFNFQVRTLFSNIAFLHIQNRYYPIMASPNHSYDMKWIVGENNQLLKSEKNHYNHNRNSRAQKYLDNRYPNGLSEEGYTGLVNAFTGDLSNRTDTLVAWSRSIANFYEENHSDPEDFLRYVNHIGRFSQKDLFLEAYDNYRDHKQTKVASYWNDILGVFMVGLLLSFLAFSISIVLRLMGSSMMNTQRFDGAEFMFFIALCGNLFINGLSHIRYQVLEIQSFPIWVICFSMAAVFYINQKFLVPKLLLNKKWGIYLLAVFGLSFGFFVLSAVSVLTPLNDYHLFFIEESWSWELIYDTNGFHGGPDEDDIFMTQFFLMIIAPIYGLGRYMLFNRMPRLKIQKEALNAELSNLKTQISPHFFFNSLNTVYGFALGEESPKTAEAITKMSNLMRFAIYHGDKDFITLETELDYLADYIELQRLRMNPVRHQLSFHVEGDPEEQQIAPLLLITLVENAFKHGISMSHDSYIRIDLFIQKNGLILTVENSVHPSQKVLAGANEGQEVEGGIGLTNTRQRLDLLYAGKYDWQIEENENRYFAQLSLDL